MEACRARGLEYRKREAYQSPLWRILVDHRETFLRQYDRRFLATHGPLPTGTEDALERILRCGDPNYGLTPFHCADCKIQMALPFSCKQRICPSCSNRRAEDVSERLLELLPKVTYRHVVVTLPMKMGLRKRLQQNPRLYRHVSRLLHRLFCRWLPAQIGCHRNRRGERERALPGVIMAVQTFGTGLRQHPRR